MGRRLSSFGFAAALFGIAAGPLHAQAALTPGHLTRRVVFDEQSPLATNAALLQRLLGPLQRLREVATLADKHETVAVYPLNLSAERFTVYLPKRRPAAGYGLLVFIPPSQDAPLPLGWAGVLDRAGYIFASAERSGNEENFASRRIPLALTAAHALTRRYRIDPDRVVIGGFSGGSRVALRIALAYPDIFSRVLLNAGSDPIGGAEAPLPSVALMSLLQTHSRFAFVTGDGDDLNLAKDAETRMSLSRWCVEATTTIRPPNSGHEIMDASALSLALSALNRPDLPDPARFKNCQAKLDAALMQARSDAEVLRAQPKSPAADSRLDRLDRTYGALIEEPASN